MGLLLNRVAGVQSQADLQALRDQLAARIRVISRRLEPVQGPRRADRVRVLLRVVGAAPSSPPETAAIFETAGLVLDVLSSRMTRLANGDLGDAINPSGADEIARMEGAAEVFRQQAIANGDLAAERERQLKELRRHRSELQGLVDEQTEALRGEVAAHDAARDRAEAAGRAKSEFLAMMSHEIRTPMNGVLEMLSNLPRGGLTPDQVARLDAARASGKALMGLLNSILDYSKLEQGQTAGDTLDFDLAEALGDIALLMAPMAEEKGLRLVIELPEVALPPLRGDMGKLRQILFNLVSNAVKFTDQGDVRIAVTVQGPVDADPLRLRFTVSDTGRGIAPDALERSFDAFQQEDPQTARTHGGTGLGLTISRRLAGLMGGVLTVASQRGQGASFTLHVPFQHGTARPVRHPPPVPGLRPRAVLEVKDHPVNQAVADGFLTGLGHHPVIAGIGEAALELAVAQDARTGRLADHRRLGPCAGGRHQGLPRGRDGRGGGQSPSDPRLWPVCWGGFAGTASPRWPAPRWRILARR